MTPLLFRGRRRCKLLLQVPVELATGGVSGESSLGKRRKLYEKIVGGESDASVPFDRTRSLLLYLEFEERTRGSHHIFKRAGIQERVNLQPTREGTVKPYQVQQLRELLTRHELGEEL